jgi:hypothetical protein
VRPAISRFWTFLLVPALGLELLMSGGCASNAHKEQLASGAPSAQHSTSVTQENPAVNTAPAFPQDAPGQSRALTDYLKNHRLPLVGANVVGDGNDRQIILYGFVATPRGRADAESRVREVVRDPKAKIVDRIVMRPELLTMNGSQSAEASGPPADPNVLGQVADSSGQTVPDDATQYQRQQKPGWTDLIIAILMIAPMFIP